MEGNSIKASGRSSSQRSIHEYPEHLNPFYEDENHKRLRFWKIGKDKSNRSNSFSIDGLKGLWWVWKKIYSKLNFTFSTSIDWAWIQFSKLTINVFSWFYKVNLLKGSSAIWEFTDNLVDDLENIRLFRLSFFLFCNR